MITARNHKAARHRLRLMEKKQKPYRRYTKYLWRLDNAIEDYEDAELIKSLDSDPEWQALLDLL